MESLSLRTRFVGVVGAAALAFLGSPGVLSGDGSLALAVLSVALWAWTALHPLGNRPKAALFLEWFGGALTGGLMMWWVVYVVLGGVLYIGAGFGVYFVVQGALLRRLARRLPLSLAVGLVWTGVELVRALVPPPFGLGWFRLGFYTHAHLWLSGSARVIGLEGLTFVVAALGGGVAGCVLARRVQRGNALAAFVPLLAAAGLAVLVPAPSTVDGPRVLLVQPGFDQARKQFDDPEKNFAASRELTRQAAAAAGAVDLTCWGESMLYLELYTQAAEAAIRGGTAQAPPWSEPIDRRRLDFFARKEDDWVRGQLLGQRGALSPGSALAVGAEFFDPLEGLVRRRVALVVYDAAGQRSAPAFKQLLVPLGETFFGMERYQWVRDLALSAAGYVPDLVPGSETGVLELHARDGQTYRLSGTVCFDNAHPWPYVQAAQGPLDFHLVASNEAWYRTSCEMDQMLAFSRIMALMTGRAFVRATNSGVSAVLGPDGRELGRVRDAAGRDRAVAGFGAWNVPVPPSRDAPPMPYVGWSRVEEILWLLALALGALFAGRASNREPLAG